MMKRINFVDTISATSYRQVRYWWYISCIVIGGNAIAMGIILIKQWYNLKTVGTTYQTSHRVQQLRNQPHHKDLLQQQKVLQQQELFLQQLHKTIEAAPLLLSQLVCAVAPGTVQNLHADTSTISCTVIAPSIHLLSNILEEIKRHTSYKHATLLRLQPAQSGITATIHSPIVYSSQ